MSRITALGWCIVCMFAGIASATSPTSITVQGKLTDTSGTPLLAGSKQFVFSIHDAESGGTKVWPTVSLEYQTLPTDVSGLWTANVGAVVPLTDAVFLDTVRWLEVAVDVGGPIVLPRVRLVTGPYAHRVSTVDGASGGTITSKVSIGPGHTNTGEQGFVVGADNIARGAYSSVSGGKDNTSFSDSTHVGGGGGNTAFGARATIGGGANNETGGDQSTIAGGRYNKAMGLSSTVGGGYENIATGIDSHIGGGAFDSASGLASTVAGGSGNKATGPHNTIGGGGSNRTSAASATVAGGFQNDATADDATVGGGYNNAARGYRSTVPGGTNNLASGANSFACGVNAWAIHDRTFMWNDDQSDNLISTAPNHFIIGTSGRIGMGTNEPEGYLHVFDGSAGSMTASINSIAVFERDSAGYLSILTPATAERGILFGEPGSIADGVLIYDAPTARKGFQLRTNGNVTRAVLDSLGQFGIGLNNPSAVLHAVSPHSSTIVPGDVGIFQSSGATRVSIRSPQNQYVALALGHTSGGSSAEIVYDQPGELGEVRFFINGALEMSLSSTDLLVENNINASGCIIGSNISCPSDARLKKNVRGIHDPLEAVLKLNGVRFEWKDNVVKARGYREGEHIGLIAQNVREVVPDAVIPMDDGQLSVDYSRLVPLLIEAVKQQQRQINDLKASLEAMRP